MNDHSLGAVIWANFILSIPTTQYSLDVTLLFFSADGFHLAFELITFIFFLSCVIFPFLFIVTSYRNAVSRIIAYENRTWKSYSFERKRKWLKKKPSLDFLNHYHLLPFSDSNLKMK